MINERKKKGNRWRGRRGKQEEEEEEEEVPKRILKERHDDGNHVDDSDEKRLKTNLGLAKSSQ